MGSAHRRREAQGRGLCQGDAPLHLRRASPPSRPTRRLHRATIQAEWQAMTLPRRGRGRQSDAAEAAYRDEVEAFCERIIEIDSRLDFKVSARGYGYILEGDGDITKDELDAAENIINECRKDGSLPLDITAVDETR